MSLSAIRPLLVPVLGSMLAVFLTGCSTVQQAPARAASAAPDPFRVMTFNIRFNNPADSLNAWPYRRDGVANLIRFYDPDLIGLQEAQRPQLDDLQRLLPGYRWFGQPRNDGSPRDEHSSVMYRTDRFEAVDQGTFWLSPTPNVPASRGWDANLPRIATWGRFRDLANGGTVLHVNTHFDHIGVQARDESARLLKRWLAENASGLPVILTGDLNAPPSSTPIQILLDPAATPALQDAISISAEPPYGPASTWNGFKAIEPGRRIDFIFVGNGVRVLEHAILAETFESGRYPSDHLPVLAEVVVERR
ncbi:MAG: endonuclease/exonuclease/phosphatase family protein [Gemmatimonadetes bacterium]|nr:endonuclease/exonuclease/phosphatase family protein [Gemmatimonadota bacterium]